MGELNRMTQFKDKSGKNEDNINAGLFTYPVLMAADILAYNAHLVPVGADQKQHIELTRDLAERFNKAYGETFVVPKPYITKTTAKIMGLQDPLHKMSKSNDNLNDTIFLDDSKEDIMKKFKKAVTDSENLVKYDPENKPGVSNLMSILGAVTGKTNEEIEVEFADKGYGDFKVTVAEAVIAKLEPIQAKYNELMNNPKYLEEVYIKGAEKATLLAARTLREVKNKIGII